MSSSPPTAAIRSRMLINPMPPGRIGIVIPTPSSVTRNWIFPLWPRLRTTVTRASGPACLIAFCTASLVQK